MKVKIEGNSGILIKELRYNLCNLASNATSLVVLATLVIGFGALVVIGDHYIPKLYNKTKRMKRKKS